MPHARFFQLRLGAVAPLGYLKELLERNKAGMGGKMPEIEPELVARPYVTRDHPSHFRADWTAEISGTYWCALIQLAYTLNDPELIERARVWVQQMLQLQEPDGFLGAYRPEDDRFEDYCSWGSNWAYRALLCYYDATGEPQVLDALHRALLWFVDHWSGDRKTTYAGPVITDSMVTVYHLTGDRRLYDFAAEYRDWLAAGHDYSWHGVDSIRRARFQFHDDHVVAFGENFKHPALLYTVSGDENDLAASEAGFRQIHARSWQVTEAPSSSSEHFSPPSCILETEYCNFATFLNSFAWLGKITGQSEWFDRMEKILFNGAMGARMKNEKAIAYMSCPNQSGATSVDGSYNSFMTVAKRVYAPNYYVACCPMQSIRIWPEYIRNSFFFDKEDDSFAAAAYGPMKAVPEPGVEIIEETEYPFEETVRFRFRCDSPWNHDFKFRRPDWCGCCTVLRGGAAAFPVEDGEGWFKLPGPWRDEVLEVKFRMEVRLAPVKDAWFPNEPLRAYTRGPLLFCRAFPCDITEVAHAPAVYPKVHVAEGYPWYDVSVSDPEKNLQWYAIPGNAKNGEDIRVVHKTAHGYVWEDSPVSLKVPLIRSTKSWDRNCSVLAMPFCNPVEPDAGALTEMVELIPYGCSLLRQSCFPVTE